QCRGRLVPGQASIKTSLTSPGVPAFTHGHSCNVFGQISPVLSCFEHLEILKAFLREFAVFARRCLQVTYRVSNSAPSLQPGPSFIVSWWNERHRSAFPRCEEDEAFPDLRNAIVRGVIQSKCGSVASTL